MPDSGVKSPHIQGAVFGNSAHDLQLDSFTIDATEQGAGTDSGGVYSAHNAFVAVTNTNVLGGEYGVIPYRNGIVRLQGLVTITDFASSGISEADQGIINAFGQVEISTSVTNTTGGNIGVEVLRGGIADFRAGLGVTMPAQDELNNYHPAAMISVTSGAAGYVRDGSNITVGTTDMQMLNDGHGPPISNYQFEGQGSGVGVSLNLVFLAWVIIP